MKTDMKQAQSNEPTLPRKNSTNDSLWENTKQFGLAIVMALLIKSTAVEAYKIPSSSMEDTLLIGDFLLANKFVYGAQLPLVNWRLPAVRDPQPGDIVIFIFPGDMQTKYIKRCVAVGGDTVQVIDKELFVNGVRYENPPHSKFAGCTSDPVCQNFGPFIVPADEFFMMGDNRDNSYDSRWWRSVPRSLILGEAMVVHWSWNEEKIPSPNVTLQDPLSVPRVFVFNAIHFFDKVRWERLFRPIE